jgi:hypothetical protein
MFNRYEGTVVLDGSGALKVSVGGNILNPRFLDPVTANAGDPVLVDIVSGTGGQSYAVVVGRVASGMRPARATVKTVPPSSPTITVTGTDGVDYTADFISSYSPVVGNLVSIIWRGGMPTALGVVGALTGAGAAGTSPGVSAPPPAAVTGTGKYAAADTSTYWGPGGWGSWAGGNNVYQGDYGSGALTGAWFYAGSTGELSGRTVTAIRFMLSSRNGAGATSSPVTAHLYAHTSANRPGGNVSLAAGPYDVTVQPWEGQHMITLPLSFAATLQAGGGIAISGNPYAGFLGRSTEPMSGYLEIDWSA